MPALSNGELQGSRSIVVEPEIAGLRQGINFVIVGQKYVPTRVVVGRKRIHVSVSRRLISSSGG
jgi:hypothetical protein